MTSLRSVDSKSARAPWPEVDSSAAHVGCNRSFAVDAGTGEIPAAHRVPCTHPADIAGRFEVAGVL